MVNKKAEGFTFSAFFFFHRSERIKVVYPKACHAAVLVYRVGRDEWMPSRNHLKVDSEARVLLIWMGCQQQR